MSLKTKIRLPEYLSRSVIGLVGISSLDNYVYIWEKKYQQSHSIIIIYQVNPLVPRSWRVFKEISLDYNASYSFNASFNSTCSKMAFRYRFIYNVRKVRKDELLLVDMSSDQTETRLIQNFVGGADIFYDFAETAVGWVAVVKNSNEGKIYCCKMFPESVENQILLTLALEPPNLYSYFYKNRVGLTYDSFMYIECSKVVSYNFLSANSAEMAYGQGNSNFVVPYPSLIGTSDKCYLIRPSEDPSQGNRVYKVQQDHLGITLIYSNQFYGQEVNNIERHNWKAGNDKMAFIHGPSVTVAHMDVPSLKSLVVWAIQKHCGTIGDDGELRDGVSEEKLKKSIGYQQNKKLF